MRIFFYIYFCIKLPMMDFAVVSEREPKHSKSFIAKTNVANANLHPRMEPSIS